MRETTFRFKKFDCSHGGGSMKIGVDAVLVGAWADVDEARRIVDVGTGCGVIALMCAQRNVSAVVEAIDIDPASVAEADGNFSRSPWPERLSARLCDFNEFREVEPAGSVDLIITNPPYFDSGVQSPDTPRLQARHVGSISPASIMRDGARLLSQRGRISMIVPSAMLAALDEVAEQAGLVRRRALRVRGHAQAPVKRILAEYARATEEMPGDWSVPEEIPLLTLSEPDGSPTPEHRALCAPFYLNF